MVQLDVDSLLLVHGHYNAPLILYTNAKHYHI